MSVDINWTALTSGPDGAQLAEHIREFIHDKFQQISLPKFIRSVKVHTFDFGSVAPEIGLKDICDPLPDFYEDDDELDTASGASDGHPDDDQTHPLSDSTATIGAAGIHTRSALNSIALAQNRRSSLHTQQPPDPVSAKPHRLHTHLTGLSQSSTPLLSGMQSPGIAGSSSNLNYFHLPLTAGLSGTATPLAAVAGHFPHAPWPENLAGLRSFSPPLPVHEPSGSVSPPGSPSAGDPSSRPPSRHFQEISRGNSVAYNGSDQLDVASPLHPPTRLHEPQPEDIQVVAHVKYSGDLRMSLTAEILLDYPMPSFVGIPLILNITGVEFDGVAVLAYIRRRAHFCFLSPEDADALVGRQGDLDSEGNRPTTPATSLGGLLERIKVESAIGNKNDGKQSLKNVGKVEKFVLEQVRRIFEDELVYPSFWTILV